jgi:hypothetical protein
VTGQDTTAPDTTAPDTTAQEVTELEPARQAVKALCAGCLRKSRSDMALSIFPYTENQRRRLSSGLRL